MGNKMCKKKSNGIDGTAKNNREKKSSWKLERIINRFNLKPTSWKSESHLSQKQQQSAPKKLEDEKKKTKSGESIFYTQPTLSKSSDWTDVNLEVPSADDDNQDVTDHIHIINPNMNLIFDNEKGTPTPPPRKQHLPKKDVIEKIEKINNNNSQTLQNNESNLKPVDEPIMVKKKINYKCPQCDNDEIHHNRDHHHHHNHHSQQKNKSKPKETKRKKNLSVISLPNYTDLKLSIASSNNDSSNTLNSSRLSLQGKTNNSKKNLTRPSSTSKLDSYMNRCRSFGSFFPQQFRKFKKQVPPPSVDDKKVDVTSDDSFGPLEDWDLGLIEHYNPKDTSLPRPKKVQKSPANVEKEMLSEIESLIVPEEEIDVNKPKAPIRRNESLVKKQQQDTSSNAVPQKKTVEDTASTLNSQDETLFGQKTKRKELDKDNIEHSSLMRILQEFSMKDKQTNSMGSESLTPSLVEFERNLVEDFIQAEKSHTKSAFS